MIGKGRITAPGALFVALCSSWGVAMEAPVAAEVPNPGIEEITVTGQRSIFILVEQVSAAQDAMYALYNELNTDNQYDIECKMETRLFSHTKQKVCLPTYARRAMQTQAQNRVRGAQGQGGSMDPMPTEVLMISKYPEMDAKFTEVMQSNPEFFSAVAKHYELSEMLRARRQTHFGEDE